MQNNVSNEPDDKSHRFRSFLPCLVFFLHGVTSLLSWNVFITNNEYFVGYKMNSSEPSSEPLKQYFINYLVLSFFVILLLFSLINLFIHVTCNLVIRMAVSLSCILSLLVVVVVMVFVPFNSVVTFFSLTMLVICLISIFNGVFQTSVYGTVAGFSKACTKALQVGSASSGVLTSLFVILSYTLISDPIKAALIYFLAAISFILLSILSTPFLNKLKARQKSLKGPGVNHLIGSKEGCLSGLSVEQFKNDITDYCAVFKKAKIHLATLLLTNIVSLTCFPGLISNIQPTSPQSPLQNPLFTMVFVFLFFNLFMLIGSLINFLEALMIPPIASLIISILRIIIIPIFLYTNISPSTRSHPVIFHDVVFIVTNVILAFSHGYMFSLLFVKIPLEVGDELKEKAGMLASFVNTLGILVGVALSLLLLSLL